MTLKEVQELVDAWDVREGNPATGELGHLASLTGQAGELARILSRRMSEHTQDPSGFKKEVVMPLAQILWSIAAISNMSGADLTEGIIDLLEEKNRAHMAHSAF